MSALGGVVEEWKNASPGGKALAITAVIAVAGLGIYTAHTKSGNSPNVSLLPVGVSGDSTSTSSPTSTPIANLFGVVRGKGSLTYDKHHAGIPVHLSTDASSKTVTEIPWNTLVQLIGGALQGKNNYGTNTWYQVSYNGQTGYISAYDLATSYQGSNGVGSNANIIGSIGTAPSIQRVQYP